MARGLADYRFSSHRPKMFTDINKQHVNRIKGLAWDTGTGSVHAQSRYQCLLSHVITDGKSRDQGLSVT